jgi:hypothetical protein
MEFAHLSPFLGVLEGLDARFRVKEAGVYELISPRGKHQYDPTSP